MFGRMAAIGTLALCLALGIAAPAPAADVVAPPERLSGYTFDYGVSWNGIPAAEARATLNSTGSPTIRTHSFHLEGWTLPLLRLLWPARGNVEAEMRADASPLRFFFHRRERFRERTSEMTFDRDAQVLRIVRRKSDGEVEELTRPLDGPRTLYDPVSMLFALRSEPMDPGAAYEAYVAIDDDLYWTKITVVDHGTTRLAGREVPTMCLEPTFEKVRSNGEREPVSKVKSIRVWATDDALRIPVYMTARAFIGRVAVGLWDVSPSLETLYAELDGEAQAIARSPQTAGE